ncbi:MAG: hypothetical protein CL947_01925 [Epsilonproteobacteria bacterium]|nr:hypothetical protein [Campylobacterota bacterium]|tara:strand:+ start:1296 stop:1829 length:534 start_codon:yes stop_codon:yes gene_type:complete
MYIKVILSLGLAFMCAFSESSFKERCHWNHANNVVATLYTAKRDACQGVVGLSVLNMENLQWQKEKYMAVEITKFVTPLSFMSQVPELQDYDDTVEYQVLKQHPDRINFKHGAPAIARSVDKAYTDYRFLYSANVVRLYDNMTDAQQALSDRIKQEASKPADKVAVNRVRFKSDAEQ